MNQLHKGRICPAADAGMLMPIFAHASGTQWKLVAHRRLRLEQLCIANPSPPTRWQRLLNWLLSRPAPNVTDVYYVRILLVKEDMLWDAFYLPAATLLPAAAMRLRRPQLVLEPGQVVTLDIQPTPRAVYGMFRVPS